MPLPEPIEQREYLCDGRLRWWWGAGGEVLSPVHLAISDSLLRPVRLGSYPLLDEGAALNSLAAAKGAYDRGRGEWPSMTMGERIGRVERLLLRMRGCREEVVRLLVWEVGKSLAESRMEFDRTIEYIEDTIAELRRWERVEGGVTAVGGFKVRRHRVPWGVVLSLGPYNNPFYETYTILVPALLMGNTVIFKPPRFGVLLHGLLLPALAELFPPGVINCLYGEAGVLLPALMKSGEIDMLAFIGSVKVADMLRAMHPRPRRLRCLLGLEAKNAAVVLEDAELERTARECVLGALGFNGQRCTALKVLFVHQKIVHPFLALLAGLMEELPMGMPWQPGVRITPMPDPGRLDLLKELLDDALAKGAKIINPGGGRIICSLMTPALLYPVDSGMRIYREEQFGPLVPVLSFDDSLEPLDYVVDSDYGQQVSIFGDDRKRIAPLVRALLNQVSRININGKCQRGPDRLPFTGRRNSAEGVMGVAQTLEAFSGESLVVE